MPSPPASGPSAPPGTASRRAVVSAPATLGNFGPGFDVTSLALTAIGDTVELAVADADSVEVVGPGAESIPSEFTRNVAGATIEALRRATGVADRFALRVTKGQPPGSGLGSSASSAGGAALAFHALYGRRLGLKPEQLVDAAGWGEAVAAGRHLDDVGAVVQGGLSIVRPPSDPAGLPELSRVQPPEALHIAVALPQVTLSTHDMRAVLPKQHPRGDAVANLANVALLVDAFHRGDVAAIGRAMEDRIAAIHRAPKVPGFRRAREAALAAGAYGFALGGSGPAMFAVCDDPHVADEVAEAMRKAVTAGGISAKAFVALPEREVMHRAVLVS